MKRVMDKRQRACQIWMREEEGREGRPSQETGARGRCGECGGGVERAVVGGREVGKSQVSDGGQVWRR
jgi:hypothetical protein